PMLPRLDNFAKPLLWEGLGAGELHRLDADFRAFLDFEGGRRATSTLVDGVGVFCLGLGVSLFLIKLLDFPYVGEELALIKGFAHFRRNGLAELGVGELL